MIVGNMYKWIIIFNLVFLPAFSVEKFQLITVPKSGTFLIIKYFSLLGKSFNDPKMEKEIKNAFRREHPLAGIKWDYPSWFDPKTKTILMIRDLRDILVSYVFWLDKRKTGVYLDRQYYKYWEKLSFDEKLSMLIDPKAPFKGTKYLWLTHPKQWTHAMNIMKLPTTYVCRFENLIGEKGGGCSIKQREEIINLAKYIGIDLSKDQINFIQHHLFGNDIKNSWTFRKGQIGNWKSHFTKAHKNQFKEQLNHFLIAFGYVEDDQW